METIQTAEHPFPLGHLGCPAFLLRVAQDGPRVAEANAAFRSVLPLTGTTSAPLARRIGALARAAGQARSPVTRDLRLCTAAGDMWWRVTLRSVGVHLYLGTAQDITDLKTQTFALTEDLARQSADLASVRSLAGLTAHDTRAPLANLVSISELILEDFDDHGDGKRQLVEACADIAKGALATIETIMERTRESEPARPRRERLNFGDICRDAAALADPSERLEIVFPEARLETDGVLLRVGLRNLLDNAARYASGLVEIALDPVPTEGQIAVVVADDGPGFAKGTGPLDAPREDGRGFGLGAVLRLVTEAGGSLTPLPPRLGQGATVRLSLPGHRMREGSVQPSSRQRFTMG